MLRRKQGVASHGLPMIIQHSRDTSPSKYGDRKTSTNDGKIVDVVSPGDEVATNLVTIDQLSQTIDRLGAQLLERVKSFVQTQPPAITQPPAPLVHFGSSKTSESADTIKRNPFSITATSSNVSRQVNSTSKNPFALQYQQNTSLSDEQSRTQQSSNTFDKNAMLAHGSGASITGTTPAFAATGSSPNPLAPGPIIVNNASLPLHTHLRDSDFNFLPFNRKNPALWFALLEQRFAYLPIHDDDDKFWYILENLDPQIINKIIELILTFPSGSRYSYTKDTLLKKYGETNDQKLERWFRDCERGQLLPSELYSKMNSLASGQFSPELVLRLWWRRLPDYIAIGTHTYVFSANAAEAISQADRLAQLRRVSHPSTQINSISRDTSQPDTIDKLIEVPGTYFLRKYQGASRSRDLSRPHSPPQDWLPD